MRCVIAITFSVFALFTVGCEEDEKKKNEQKEAEQLAFKASVDAQIATAVAQAKEQIRSELLLELTRQVNEKIKKAEATLARMNKDVEVAQRELAKINEELRSAQKQMELIFEQIRSGAAKKAAEARRAAEIQLDLKIAEVKAKEVEKIGKIKAAATKKAANLEVDRESYRRQYISGLENHEKDSVLLLYVRWKNEITEKLKLAQEEAEKAIELVKAKTIADIEELKAGLK